MRGEFLVKTGSSVRGIYLSLKKVSGDHPSALRICKKNCLCFLRALTFCFFWVKPKEEIN